MTGIKPLLPISSRTDTNEFALLIEQPATTATALGSADYGLIAEALVAIEGCNLGSPAVEDAFFVVLIPVGMTRLTGL